MAMISNYSTSYNVVNIGIVIPVLNYSISQSSGSKYYAFPAEPYYSTEKRRALEYEDEEDSIVASSLLAGMIIGQLVGGLLGDAFGRRRAMTFIMILQIGGSVGSALFVPNGEQLLPVLAAWRFVLGIGAGGVYPLAAVMSAEDKEEENSASVLHDDWEDEVENNNPGIDEDEWEDEQRDDSAMPNGGFEAPSQVHAIDQTRIKSFQRIALTFSMQGLGFLTVPMLAYLMLATRMNAEIIWRTLLGVGALPGLAVLYLRRCSGGSCTSNELQQSGHEEEHEHQVVANSGSSHDALSTLFGDSASSRTDEPPDELALVASSHLVGTQSLDIDHTPNSPSVARRKHRGLWESIKSEPNLGRKMAGTAGTWFLFDLLFYGNTLFEPLVLEAAFSNGSSTDGRELLQSTVRSSLIISLLSLPGYFMTVILIGRRTCVCARSSATRCGSASCFPCYQTPSYIQLQGFFVMFILYLIIGLCWDALDNIPWLLLVLYAGTFFFANYGPNTTTFLLPSVTFSKDCRSTLNGISASCGKIGALLGASGKTASF